MGERLRELGGSLVVASQPGRGFEVRATVPLSQGVA
jgi:signal transduction histidine kinase